MRIQPNGLVCIYALECEYSLSLRAYDGRMAIILYTVAVWSDPVHPGDITEVLDRPGFKKGIPRVDSRRRPVGHTYEEIVGQRLRRMVIPVATPNRETQIVAHQGTNTPAFP